MRLVFENLVFSVDLDGERVLTYSLRFRENNVHSEKMGRVSGI